VTISNRVTRGAIALALLLVIPGAAGQAELADVQAVDRFEAEVLQGRAEAAERPDRARRESPELADAAEQRRSRADRPDPKPEPEPEPEPEPAPESAPAPAVAADCDEYAGNRAIGCTMLLDAGFSLDQMSCLDTLWEHESGWNELAENPSSGAYGIPQALPGDKMASHGGDWQTNPATQIAWGLDYIAGRYSTPCGAWEFWQANGWY
jgi:hypothetical protein